jgi:type I restriction enzyme, S subunit
MELRAGYRDSVAGLIPNNWDAVTIGEVVTFSGGSQPPRSTFKFSPTSGYVRLIQIRDYKTDAYASYIPASMARKTCTSGDIMIGRYGPPIFQILRGIEGAYNVALIKATPSERISRAYLFNVLKQEKLFRLIDSLSRRSSGQTGVEMPALKAYGLALPPLSEQDSISTLLTDVDLLISTIDQLIAKKRDLKQASMQQLLTGQTRLPGFSGEWEVKRLGDIGGFLKGRGVRKDEANSGSIPCVRYGEIYTHHTDYIQEFKSWISNDVAGEAVRLAKGDLLFAGSGETKAEIGKCVAFVSEMEAYAGGDIVILRQTAEDPFFMGYLCNMPNVQSQKSAKGQGDAVVHISSASLAAIEVLIPHPTEQRAIARVIFDMDAEIGALQARRNKTRALKQAMMQELLTGRIRLVDPEPEAKPHA